MKKKRNMKQHFMQATEDLLHMSFNKKDESEKSSTSTVAESISDITTPEFSSLFETPITEPIIEETFIEEAPIIVKPNPNIKTTIDIGTCVNGDIRCDENMVISGELTGNITGSSVITLHGNITGQIECEGLNIHGGTINGDINASGSINIDENSTVIGNITCGSLCLNGKVKGDLRIKDALTLQSKSIVLGKFNVGSISVQDGAVFSGEIQMSTQELSGTFAENAWDSNPSY